MKVKYISGGNEEPLQIAELTLENVGVNRFRASIPLKDGANRVLSRTAEIEAASEKTKAGTVRVMLKCTIPYMPQITNADGTVAVDSTKSPKPYTMHIVHTIPAIMASEALEGVLARQAAQVIALASSVIGLGLITSRYTVADSNSAMYDVPLQVGPLSVDGVASYPLAPATKAGPEGQWVEALHNVEESALAGSLVGRALIGLMPIDINNDKTIRIPTTLVEAT